MLDGRLYRIAFAPLLLVMVIAAFSLTDRPTAIGSNLPADQFDGTHASALLTRLVRRFGHRRPGSAGDDALADFVARQLRRPAGAAGASAAPAGAQQPAFAVSVRRFQGQTIDGTQDLENVVATRPGNLSGQLVVMAHRDAAGTGAAAELSGTAALLELAQVLSGRVTSHTVTLVSTSGGSGGDAGAVDFAAHTGGPVDAVIVLGDLAGRRAHRPFVVSWSDGRGGAPARLVSTVSAAVASEVGVGSSSVGAISQFAHLALPFAVGEQGVLDARGLPAVLLQVSGERGPPSGEGVSSPRLTNFGRAALRSLNALDADPHASGGPDTGIVLGTKVLPAWAVRLLVGALLAPALLLGVDGLARLRRRRAPVATWLTWVLSCALPFFACALFAVVIARIGLLGAAPVAPVLPRALPVAGSSLIVVALVLALAWVCWRPLTRALGTAGRPDPDAAGICVLVVLDALVALVWLVNPFCAALLIPAVHVSLVVASPELRPRAPLALALVAAALVPPLAVVTLYAHQLGMGPLQVCWTALLLVAGGHVGLVAAAGWSLGLGCLVAATMVAVRCGPAAGPRAPVTVRGPAGYAGPGSLGGTESALRR